MCFDRERIRKQAAELAAEGVFIGTSSWKYEGWFGQLYTPARYEYRGKVAKTRFERDCLKAACKKLGIGHVTPHGLRSYFVTQARQSGLSDAEITMLIGDKTGPAIIAHTYGDVRPDHLLAQAQRIRLAVAVPAAS